MSFLESHSTDAHEENINKPLRRKMQKTSSATSRSPRHNSSWHQLSRPSSDDRRERQSGSSVSDISPTRRALSDSLLTNPGSRSGGNNFPMTNATFSLVQRSGKPMLRKIISTIKISADGVQQNQQASSPPEAECDALANCARDAYYRVIISSLGGIPAIVRAMEAFPAYEGLQASGCAALSNLCTGNGSNQAATEACGGIRAVASAMRSYPLSIAVQSAACDALMHLTSMVPGNVDALRRVGDFPALLGNAMERFLPPSCRQSAEVVKDRIYM